MLLNNVDISSISKTRFVLHSIYGDNFVFFNFKNLDLLLNESNQKIDHIFFLNVNKETVVERIKKRKILEKRTDDDVDTILKRYDTYIETTRPVLDYYSKNSNFHEIDGTMKIDQITSKIEAFLNV